MEHRLVPAFIPNRINERQYIHEHHPMKLPVVGLPGRVFMPGSFILIIHSSLNFIQGLFLDRYSQLKKSILIKDYGFCAGCIKTSTGGTNLFNACTMLAPW
jgi:hypothetical protein